MPKKKSNKMWLQAQHRDQYCKQARQSHYRSRAVYKLSELNKKHHIFKPNDCVVDLGAAPGSWSQYASEQVGANGHIIAVDILPMEPINRVSFVQGDFTDIPPMKLLELCQKHTEKNKVDLVISDIAPNLTGIRVTDQARSIMLVEAVYDFCQQALKPGGNLLIKLFEGVGTHDFRNKLQECFVNVAAKKPRGSRDHSREFYILAHSYRV